MGITRVVEFYSGLKELRSLRYVWADNRLIGERQRVGVGTKNAFRINATPANRGSEDCEMPRFRFGKVGFKRGLLLTVQ
jgi:hypothetical protein